MSPDLEAKLRLTLIGPTGVRNTVVAVIDTGYTVTLTLPGAVVRRLGLSPLFETAAVLADGSFYDVVKYGADVEWGGIPRPIAVTEFGNEVLAGVGLFADHELNIEMQSGGRVDTRPIYSSGPELRA